MLEHSIGQATVRPACMRARRSSITVTLVTVLTSVASASTTSGENMATLPPIPNVLRAVINTSYAGEPCANVLHYHQTIADGDYIPGLLAEALAQKWVTNIAPICPETVELVSVTCADLDPTPNAPGQNVTGSGTSGGNATPQLPNNVAACITLRTAAGGRSGRGRLYHVGMAENNVILNVMDPAYITSLITAYNAFSLVSDSVGQQYRWGVLSYYTGGSLRSTPVWNMITSITCDSTIDSMRKRIPGH